jgi:hypothetical protein
MTRNETIQKRHAESAITLEDRFEHGNLTVKEICELKPTSRSGFYADVKRGLVEIVKIGRKTVIRGPVAKRYIALDSRAE